MKVHPYTVAEGRPQSIWLLIVLGSFLLAATIVFLVIPLLSWSMGLFHFSDIGGSNLWSALETIKPVVQGSPLLLSFYIVYRIFDEFVWKWRIIRAVPNLNGTWEGELISQGQPNDPLRITLKIRQSWSNIMITIESARTFSYSVNASVSFEGPERVEVINTYVAEPKPSAKPSVINRHFGTNIFHFRIENQRLVEVSGIYYTEKNQGNNGAFEFNVV